MPNLNFKGRREIFSIHAFGLCSGLTTKEETLYRRESLFLSVVLATKSCSHLQAGGEESGWEWC